MDADRNAVFKEENFNDYKVNADGNSEFKEENFLMFIGSV
jgi:hypothetical protein